MSKALKKTIDTLMNKEVSMIINKTRVFIADKNVDIKDGFFIARKEDNVLTVNQNNILYTSFTEDRAYLKIGYLVPELVTGVVTNIDQKFITVQIFNNKIDKCYDVVIPLGVIQGIKVMEFYDKGNK